MKKSERVQKHRAISLSSRFIIATFFIFTGVYIRYNVSDLAGSAFLVVGDIFALTWIVGGLIYLINEKPSMERKTEKKAQLPHEVPNEHKSLRLMTLIKSTFHKRTSVILLALTILLILIAGILFGIDYLNYGMGNRSAFFGTLDSYTSNQTLKFGNLDLKVSDVTLKSYPEPTPPPADCSTESSPSSSGRIDWGISLCEYRKTTIYPDLVSHYQTKNELIVEFRYANISDVPINLSEYKVKVVANTAVGSYDSPSKACTGISSNHSFLRGYSEEECLSNDIDKGYDGPLALSVTKGGVEKIINLVMPKLINQ